MFGQGSTFMGLNGAGGEVRLAQAPVYSGPSAPMPSAAPAAPAAQAPSVDVAPTPVSTGLSHGAKVAIGVGLLGLTLLGTIFLTD